MLYKEQLKAALSSTSTSVSPSYPQTQEKASVSPFLVLWQERSPPTLLFCMAPFCNWCCSAASFNGDLLPSPFFRHIFNKHLNITHNPIYATLGRRMGMEHQNTMEKSSKTTSNPYFLLVLVMTNKSDCWRFLFQNQHMGGGVINVSGIKVIWMKLWRLLPSSLLPCCQVNSGSEREISRAVSYGMTVSLSVLRATGNHKKWCVRLPLLSAEIKPRHSSPSTFRSYLHPAN